MLGEYSQQHSTRREKRCLTRQILQPNISRDLIDPKISLVRTVVGATESFLRGLVSLIMRPNKTDRRLFCGLDFTTTFRHAENKPRAMAWQAWLGQSDKQKLPSEGIQTQ
ncbi:hypothetical protein FPOAC2_07695 [Fusarium poae]